jgi:hypothetical protein
MSDWPLAILLLSAFVWTFKSSFEQEQNMAAAEGIFESILNIQFFSEILHVNSDAIYCMYLL